jgi:hypothetical protein
MEPRALLRLAGIFAAVVTVALALCGNALAWESTVTKTGTILNRNVHVNDGPQSTATCPTFSEEAQPNPALREGEVGACTHWIFHFGRTGTATVIVSCASVPATSELGCDMQEVEPVLCLVGTDGVTDARCPMNSSALLGGNGETTTCTTPVPVTDPATGNPGLQITCPVPVTGTYELILAPTGVNTCPPFIDPVTGLPQLCPVGGPGIEAHVRVDFVSDVKTNPHEGDHFHGGGQSDDHRDKFHNRGHNDHDKQDRNRVHYEHRSNDNSRCRFYSTDGQATVVRNPLGGGSIDMVGNGIVVDYKGVKHTVTYRWRAVDGGPAGVDTYQLQANGCDTGPTPVVVTNGKMSFVPGT